MFVKQMDWKCDNDHLKNTWSYSMYNFEILFRIL